MKQPFFIMMTFLLWTSSVFGQQAVLSSGTDVSGTGGTASFSVGQVLYTSNKGSVKSESFGVQQTYIDTILTNVNYSDNLIKMKAYPNPTSDRLQLEFLLDETKELSVEISDMSGKILLVQENLFRVNTLNTINYEPGTYILNVFRDEKLINTYRIIKN